MNNINYQILYKLILNNFVAYLKIFFVLVFINIAYFFIKTPTYTSEVSFYATYNDMQEASLFSPLSSLMDSTGSLNFSISDYVKSDKILQELVEKEYIIDGEKENLVDFWGSDFINFYDLNPISFLLKINKHLNLNPSLSDFDKKTFFAKETLSGKIDFSENRITSIYNVSITVGKYPSLSKEIIENAYNSILNYVGQIENSKASEKIIFIKERLNQVSLELKEAENEKLVFLQNNKRPFSASLILKEQRIQRKISLHADVYLNLSNQLELAKISQKDNTSSIFILDKANLASEKDGRSLLINIIIIFLLSFVCYYLFIIYKNINQIISNKK
ncbi:MAG: hypothetical protein HN595_04210 [Flavobacteriaceae bacterium]|jgi:uncharacterized protein involved in exopolysaccharide biosynthesis|nr:hypothetical protein [Flavobacteriaceae bacterium]